MSLALPDFRPHLLDADLSGKKHALLAGVPFNITL